MDKIKKYIDQSTKAKKTLIKSEKKIFSVVDLITKAIKKGGKIMLCGNGGSAADAQHLAAEFLIRLRPAVKRRPFPAITLAQDTSTLTACGNDFNFEDQFSRCLQALGKKNDVLIAISTSGNSKNIIKVLKEAEKMGILSVGFLGNGGGKAKKLCNFPIIVGSKNVARIQESHIFLGHYIFELVENQLIK